MSWVELSFDTTSEAIDWVYTLLQPKVGYNGENCKIRVSQYPQQEFTAHPWEFNICIYLPDHIHVNSQIRDIENTFNSLQRTGLANAITTTLIENPPPINYNSQTAIHHVGQKFVIIPADIDEFTAKPHQIIIKTKSSLAFGSGFHPATILALQLIERHITSGMTGLDLGSGSGILSVAIAKLKAQVLALDNDRIATQATRDMVECNHVQNLVTVKQGSLGSGSHLGHWMGGNLDLIEDVEIIQPHASFDFIVANILGRIHIQLASEYQQALSSIPPGGILITAGFNNDMETEVASAFTEYGFKMIDSVCQDEWVAFAHQLSTNSELLQKALLHN